MTVTRTIRIASRGSALALVQANMILAQCRGQFPDLQFELNIIRTTGDKLQTVSDRQANQESTKGLFTKELEVALLNGEADLAVHSLKDLPTELPSGLTLGAASQRADVRDVFIYRDAAHTLFRGLPPQSGIRTLPDEATVATTSTRRQAQLLAIRPDLKTIPIRGNVGTRLQKLVTQPELDGIVLAAAGLARLGFKIEPSGRLSGEGTPEGLLAVFLSIEEMLPCVGQAALGIENRESDPEITAIVEKLNDAPTFACVTAERSFLHAMGGGCLSPVAALATVSAGRLHLRAASFRTSRVGTAEATGSIDEPVQLGCEIARRLV